MSRVAVVVSVGLHALAAAALAWTPARPPAPVGGTLERLEVVVEVAPPTPPAAPPERVVDAVRERPALVSAAPSPRAEAPPPPSGAPASAEEPPVVVGGISFESTSATGTFAVATGNTLHAAPDSVARDPSAVRPYKAATFATASELAEAPRVLNHGEVEIRRFYPKDALQRSQEGEVVLRLVIDADGSIAEATVVRDPGHGMGPAALRAVREFRFAPGRVGATPVATTIPFVIRFVIS